jgi:hypothetical protein
MFGAHGSEGDGSVVLSGEQHERVPAAEVARAGKRYQLTVADRWPAGAASFVDRGYELRCAQEASSVMRT